MPIAISEMQQQKFDEDGFILIENALSPEHVSRLIEVVDERDAACRQAQGVAADTAYQIRNAVAHHEELFRLMDYPKLFPLVVDVMGVNIQLRTSHVDVRPPMNAYVEQELGVRGSFFPWHSDAPDFGYPITNGAVPFFEVKIGYYLTDLTEHNSGAICVVRGSHKVSPENIHDPAYNIDPSDLIEVNVKPGTAMLWRTALWHCLTPNLSDHSRKCLYYGYNYRWMRPGDYDQQTPDLLARCSPIQRQLLSANASDEGVRYNDNDPAHPASRYWRPEPEDIPLKDWADEQLRLKEESGEAAS